MTRIVKDFPPNYEELRARFAVQPSTVYAFGDTIYSPAGTELSADLIAHEEVHFRQQRAVGGPAAWWRRYIDDPAFRLEQEVEAYRVQYAMLATLPRPERRARLAHICRLLAGGMYGRLVTKEQARKLIVGTA